MNAGNIIRQAARPIGAFVLLGALTLILSGCDRHRGSMRYYNNDGYYGDVGVYRSAPVIVHRRHYAPPPVIVHQRHYAPRPVFGRGPGHGPWRDRHSRGHR